MSGFTDSIVGGIGTLIRQYIRSPNYVPGASGWSINQDGSVEFNNGTFRGTIVIETTSSGIALLVYVGTPAFGNLLLSIAGIFGNDQYGNAFAPGVNVYSLDPAQSYGIQFNNPNGADNLDTRSGLFMPKPASPTDQTEFSWLLSNAYAVIKLVNGALFQLGNDGAIFYNPTEGIQFYSGKIGKAYTEQVGFSAQDVPTNSATIFNNLTAIALASDYGSAFNLVTGVWTCPVSSFYDFTYFIGLTVGYTGRFFTSIRNAVTNVPLLVHDFQSGGGASDTLNGTIYITAGTQINFQLIQYSGADKTVNPNGPSITVSRRPM